MTRPAEIAFLETDLAALPAATGRIVTFAGPDGRLDVAARRLNRLTRGAVARLVASPAFAAARDGDGFDLAFPAGLAAEAVQVVRLARRADAATARRAGATITAARGEAAVLVLAGGLTRPTEVAYGLALRGYDFTAHRTEPAKAAGVVRFMLATPEAAATAAAAAAPMAAVAEGVFFARDLVNEPANVLTTTDFAARLGAMHDLGLAVEILEEDAIAGLGMRALMAVAQGSESPARVVVMRWQGGNEGEAPLALVGKGVVFDTGGLSIKPAAGMEEMTMDMAGAAVVAGTLRALALRRARANVVGIVGLVENMPDGRAQRPGDVVRSLKGDTIEVITTDAEGRLVLADLLWYAQERFAPRAMIDLATLTGAIIVALGHENAGVFANDDALATAFLRAAAAEGEGAWRMPLAPAFDKPLKSRIADLRNTGGRPAGASIAAQFLQRFVKHTTPWVHLDIAGVALVREATALAPKGATGWGVRALDRLVRDLLEK